MNKIFHCSIIEGNEKSIISESKNICISILGDSFKDKIKKNICSDVIWIKCESNKNSIGVDEIRKINNDSIIKPVECNSKIYIIKDAQKMTEQSQNALLKTIEDPPPNVYFILLCNNLGKLLNTVKSRAHVIKIHREIKNKFSSDNEDFIDNLIKKNFFESLKILNKYCNKRENLKSFLESSKEYFIDTMKNNVINTNFEILDRFDYCISLLRYNLNVQLVAQYLCMN